MKQFPHVYKAAARGGADGTIPTNSPGLETLDTSGPPEFGGPEGYWSPETLLTASVANCFILTFRAISRKARIEWNDLDVDVEGVLDKTPDGLRFTEFRISAHLEVTDGVDAESARDVIEKAKKHCLVTASLNAEIFLESRITTA